MAIRGQERAGNGPQPPLCGPDLQLEALGVFGRGWVRRGGRGEEEQG